jgi:hypothetical protein
LPWRKNLELGLETLRECPGFIHADNLFKQEYLQRSRGLVFEGFRDCFVPLSLLFLASVRQLSFALGSSQILCPFFHFLCSTLVLYLVSPGILPQACSGIIVKIMHGRRCGTMLYRI